jgi:DNA polymerase III subunit epsilon
VSRRSAAAERYRAARVPGRRTPWRDAAFCVVDLETTGLDPRRDAIVAWSAVPVDGGRVVLGGAREGLARPPVPLPAASIRIHGLRALDLAGAPTPEEAADALLDAMAGRVLVAHAAWVERAFLGRALRGRGARLRGPAVDTAVLGRLWLSERDGGAPPRLALGTLAGELGLPVHRPHQAAGDALTTAQAFVALATHLDARGRETVRSLAGARHRLEATRVWASVRP